MALSVCFVYPVWLFVLRAKQSFALPLYSIDRAEECLRKDVDSRLPRSRTIVRSLSYSFCEDW